LPGWHTKTEATSTFFWQGQPAVDAGLVFIEDAEKVMALDAETGTVRWSRAVRHNPVGAAQLLLAQAGRVFVSEVDSILALSQADGHTLWKVIPDSSAARAYPSADENTYYTGQAGKPIVYAIDIASGSVKWKINVGPDWQFRAFVDGTAVSGDTLYVTVERWLAVNGYISSGLVVALDRNDGHQLWRYETETQTNGFQNPPVVAGRTLVINDPIGKRFFALDRFTQQLLWHVTSNINGSISTPVVVGIDVFVGSADSFVYDVDLLTGAIKWTQGTGGSISGTTFCQGSVFINNYSIERRDPKAGGKLTGYVHSNGALFTSQLATDGQRIFFTGYDGAYGTKCKADGE